MGMDTKSYVGVFAFSFAVVAVMSGCAPPTLGEDKASSESGLGYAGADDSPATTHRRCGDDGPACPSTEYCAPFNPAAAGPDLPGTCEPKKPEGGQCLVSYQTHPEMCASGLVCVEAGSTAYCTAPLVGSVGAYCEVGATSRFRCEAGLTCTNGTCEAPPTPQSPSQPGDPVGSCAGFNDASYCGLNYIHTGDPSVLYTCRGGQLIVQERCTNGCVAIRGPENDHCR